MEPISIESQFDEAFKIISTNKSKANSLRQSLLKNNNYNCNQNMQTIQYLGEFEYDLKSLYDILREIKLSYHDTPGNLIHSLLLRNKRRDQIEKENEKNNRDCLFRNKKFPCLNKCFDEINNKLKGPCKTYCMSYSQLDTSQHNINDNLKDYHIKTCPRQDRIRSYSSKSYIGNWNTYSNGFNFSPGNKNNNYIRNNYPVDKFINNNSIYSDDKYPNTKFSGKGVPNSKKAILNYDYDTYLTDYSLNKTNRKDSITNDMNSNFSEPRQNLSLSDFNNENKLNNNYINPNQNQKNNNIFTFSEPRNNRNSDLIDIGKNINNNKYSYNDFVKNKRNKSDIPNNKYTANNNNNLDNNYKNKFYNDMNNIDDKLNPDKNEKDDDLEEKKKEIIKKVISDIFQDSNKLDLLKSKFGDKIGEKLLSGNISEADLFKVVEILKNNQEEMDKRNKKFRRYFPTKKFNQPSDKVLLKELLNDKRYNYREFPRGWSSTKEFFINNGSTLSKNKKMKK